MKKLLLLLLLSVWLSNYSFAGVEDISIKCKGKATSTIWIEAGDHGDYTGTDIFLHDVSWSDESNRQFDSEGNMYVIGESSNSIKVSFDNKFRYRDLLEDGVYKLYDTEPSTYLFRKELSLDGKKGESSFFIDREDGHILEIEFEINADRPLTYDVMGHPRDDTSKITRDFGSWRSKYEGCEKFTQLF